jgi:hypothetical protein
MHPVDALPPITVRCTDYNELVFAMGFASDKKTARFLEQMVWLLRCAYLQGIGRALRVLRVLRATLKKGPVN